MKRKGLLIVAIILMSIGFAAVSTTLVINGNAKVNENTDDFDVIFTKASLDGTDVYTSVIDDTKKIINFKTNELKTLNQTSVLTYEVTNNSSNYDAEVRINCNVKENTEAKYTSIKNELEGNVSIVKAKESVIGTLTITLNKTATEEVTEEYTCTLEFNAVERDELGTSKALIPVISKDKDGTNLNATTTEIVGLEKEELLNKLKETGLINNVEEIVALIEVKSDKFEDIAITTFDVSNIAKEGDKVVILHYNEAKNEWEYIDEKTVESDGTVTANFSSYSPVAFALKKEDGTYETITSKVSKPELTNALIPVVISNDGTVEYANIKRGWYNYENKIWANAVILEENANYKEGDIIKESDIQSYFVWIPRYRYKLFNTDDYSLTTVTSAAEVESKAQEIEIEFEDKTTKASTGSKKGEWLTHPAFTSFDTNGLWVGKFETGYKGATSITGAQVNATDTSKVIIKPNVYSWRNITVKNIFETSYNYKREMDSHMMKNTEWGAVSYLSHSKYGINREININNNSSYKTGYSALPSTNQQTYPGESGDGEKYNQPYNTEAGYLASTTGNISGVYDMSGGADEYVSAYVNSKVGSSGFSTTTIKNYNNKYFDVYNASSTVTTYQYRILGDGTSEMGPFKQYPDGDNETRKHNSWYGDYSHFVDSTYPWFFRGGHHANGGLAGEFYFSRGTGTVIAYIGFRLVLTP